MVEIIECIYVKCVKPDFVKAFSNFPSIVYRFYLCLFKISLLTQMSGLSNQQFSIYFKQEKKRFSKNHCKSFCSQFIRITGKVVNITGPSRENVL
jgi:hypothetical protein